MLRTIFITSVLIVVGCKSDAEKRCLDGNKDTPWRLAACGNACQSGNPDACLKESELGTQECFKAHNEESCRRMCLYGHSSGKHLFCQEFTKLTGKSADGL